MLKPKKIRQRLLWSGSLFSVISFLCFILLWTFILKDVETHFNNAKTDIMAGWLVIAFFAGIFVFLVGGALFLYQKVKKHSNPDRIDRLEA